MALLVCAFFPMNSWGGFIAGDTIRTAQLCNTSCLDQGGVFCRPFGVQDYGYCCYTEMGLPCDKRSQLCTSQSSDVAKFYSCPFEEKICGAQTIDVDNVENEISVTSTDFKNFTFCNYQFRKLFGSGKQINIKVIFAGSRLEFKAV